MSQLGRHSGFEKDFLESAEGIQGVNDAIDAGIHSIEHGKFQNNEEGLQMMVERGTFLVPTLMIQGLIAEGKGDFTEEAVENARMGMEYNRVGFQVFRRVSEFLPSPST